MHKPLTLAALNACDTENFAAALADIWEHAPWVARSVAGQRPFASVDALHRAMVESVAQRPEAERIALFAGHPELAGAHARKGTMTTDSTREQGALALGQLAADEAAHWDALNRSYRQRFGFPFILCVKRHTRASALRMFERRLGHERTQELQATLDEIARITRLRLAARIADHGLPDIEGQLTTHVLDSSRGTPADGVRVTLHELTAADGTRQAQPLAEATTDRRGRTAEPLLGGAPLRIGHYEMRFHVGDYFRRHGPQQDWPFLEVVPVVFAIAEPEGHYHVPLTVTPWAYATYRGQ